MSFRVRWPSLLRRGDDRTGAITGAIVNLGVFKKRVEVDMQAINFKEIELFGSRVYERCDFETAIRIADKLPLDGIISHSFTLSEVTRAFAEFQSSKACKVLILPGDGLR